MSGPAELRDVNNQNVFSWFDATTFGGLSWAKTVPSRAFSYIASAVGNRLKKSTFAYIHKNYPGLETPLQHLTDYLKLGRQVTAKEFFSQFEAIARSPKNYNEDDVKNLIEAFNKTCPNFKYLFYSKMIEKYHEGPHLTALAPHALIVAEETFFTMISRLDDEGKDLFATVLFNNAAPIESTTTSKDEKIENGKYILSAYEHSLQELERSRSEHTATEYIGNISLHKSDADLRSIFHLMTATFDKIDEEDSVNPEPESLLSKFMAVFLSVKQFGAVKGSLPYARMGFTMIKESVKNENFSPKKMRYYNVFFSKIEGLLDVLESADSEAKVKETVQMILKEIGSAEQEFAIWGVDLRKWIAPFIDHESDTPFAVNMAKELEEAAVAVAAEKVAGPEPDWENSANEKKTDLTHVLITQTLFNALLYKVTSTPSECPDFIGKVRREIAKKDGRTTRDIILSEFETMVEGHDGMFAAHKWLVKTAAPIVFYFLSYYLTGFVDSMYGKVTAKMGTLSLDPEADQDTKDETINETATVMQNVTDFLGETTRLLRLAEEPGMANLNDYLDSNLSSSEQLGVDRNDLYGRATHSMSHLLPRLDEYGSYFRAMRDEKAGMIADGSASIGTHLSYYTLLAMTLCVEIGEGVIDGTIKYFLYKFLSKNDLLGTAIRSARDSVAKNSKNTAKIYNKVTEKVEAVRQAIQAEKPGEHVEIPEALRLKLSGLIRQFRLLVRESTGESTPIDMITGLAEGIVHKQVEAQLIDIIGTAYFQIANKGTFYQSLSMGLGIVIDGLANKPCGATPADGDRLEPGSVMRASIHRLIRVAVSRALNEWWRSAPAKQNAADKLLVKVHTLFNGKVDAWRELIDYDNEDQGDERYEEARLAALQMLLRQVTETTKTWTDLSGEAANPETFDDNNKLYFSRIFEPIALCMHRYYRVAKPGPLATKAEMDEYYEKVAKRREIVAASMRGEDITQRAVDAGIDLNPEETTDLASAAIALIKSQKEHLFLIKKERALNEFSAAIAATKELTKSIHEKATFDELSRCEIDIQRQAGEAQRAFLELQTSGALSAEGLAEISGRIETIAKKAEDLIETKRKLLVMQELVNSGHLQALYDIRVQDLPENKNPAFLNFAKDHLARQDLPAGVDIGAINGDLLGGNAGNDAAASMENAPKNAPSLLDYAAYKMKWGWSREFDTKIRDIADSVLIYSNRERDVMRNNLYETLSAGITKEGFQLLYITHLINMHTKIAACEEKLREEVYDAPAAVADDAPHYNDIFDTTVRGAEEKEAECREEKEEKQRETATKRDHMQTTIDRLELQIDGDDGDNEGLPERADLGYSEKQLNPLEFPSPGITLQKASDTPVARLVGPLVAWYLRGVTEKVTNLFRNSGAALGHAAIDHVALLPFVDTNEPIRTARNRHRAHR